MCCGQYRPVGAADQALEHWPRFAWPSSTPRDDILQHRLIQAEVGHQPFELRVLIFKLSQPPHLRRHQASVFLASVVERRLAVPALRHTSPNDFPSSTYLSTKAICASLNFDLFITYWVSFNSDVTRTLPLKTVQDSGCRSCTSSRPTGSHRATN